MNVNASASASASVCMEIRLAFIEMDSARIRDKSIKTKKG